MGPVLVLAGPGAGKTFCLIERIRFLIEDLRVDPDRICVFTFTNKAADEIKLYDLKLADLDDAAPVEVTCCRCGQTRTETAAALMRQPGLEQAYLDEVERVLKCAARFFS